MIDPLILSMTPDLIEIIKKLFTEKNRDEIKSDLPKESVPTSEKVKRRRRTHAQQAAGHPRRRRMKVEPG